MSTVPPAYQTVPLFPTPVLLVDVPDAERANGEWRRVLLERERSQPSQSHSTLGGRQSTWDVDRWAGAQALALLALARNIAQQATPARDGSAVTPVWRTNMWANINRSGHGNEFHSHPGAFWSGVYYVDDGGIAADPSLGGELEFMDPRGPGPAMYAPQLAFAIPGGLSVGANETVQPRAGRLVMFPAWLLHQVRPYRGTAARISVAFNLSL